MQIGFNKYNVYFTNSYYRFDSNFIRFSLFILSTKGVKPYLCRIKSNFAPDMTQVKMKIMSWKNGLLLSAVSYVFDLVMWFILDDKTIDQLPGMTIADYMVDFLLCMLFTYISLGFCFLVFRVLPFRTSYVWGMVYASCLMALNNIVAFGMITLFNFLWDETDNGLLDELLNMKGAYTFAMISTFLSSVYANSFYLQSYIKARDEKQALEMALMKAVRGAEIKLDSLHYNDTTGRSLDERLASMDDLRLFTIFEALTLGVSVEHIHDITKIDEWFICKLKNLVDYEAKIKNTMTDALYLQGKKYGYLDKTLARLAGVAESALPHRLPSYKMVDTCAAEFQAQTPYFYATFDDLCDARNFPRDGRDTVIVLGSGPIRIGQGIEFDYCSVHCVWTLKKHGCEAILVNNNPETVSTDFDTGDRLYFDPLNPESVDNIIATEKPDACVVQFGGQTAIKLAKHMDEIGLPILGTPADAIDEAEDRERFDELLERCNIPRAPGRTVFNLEEALAAADEIGLPVLMRPSYVLGGQNMIVAYTKADVIEYMGVITEHVDMDHPVLLDKYIMGTECEVDAICDGENYLIPGIMEQVERTGVHSGDSICVYPAQHLTQAEIDTMVDYTGRFARELHVTGLVNVQYAVSNGKVYVIEVNPRSSRTVPYISKVTGVPMVDLAVRCCLGEKLTDMGYGTGLHPNAPYVAVKVPVFSFEKLHGVDTQFGPEMKSTGEVLGIAPNFHDALLKGLIGAGYTFKTPGPASCCIFTVKDSDKPEFVDIAWKLKNMGYKLYGTSGTCAWLNKHMVPCNEVRNMSGEAPNIVDLLQSGLVDYVFSTSAKGRDPKRDSVRLRRKAVELSIPCITAVDTANALVNCLRSDHSMKDIPLVDIATLYHKK